MATSSTSDSTSDASAPAGGADAARAAAPAAASALDDGQKRAIQAAYRAWLAGRDFKPRRGQREMIAAVARTLAGPAPRIAVVEAGTGTGKTAAYCLAAIPLAQALGKRVVIATATVALQEQIALRDLPDLETHAGIEFTFALAKGRRRYVCLKRLDARLSQEQQELPFATTPTAEHLRTYERMVDLFSRGSWRGDIDSWEDTPEPEVWQPITTDHRGCANTRCSFFHDCPHFVARAELGRVDVIVANHDVVLADLALGGGTLLPAPDETILVIDEAHHLAEKTQRHFTARAQLRGAMQWLDQLNAAVGTCAQRFSRPAELVALATRLAADTAAAAELIKDVEAVVRGLEFPAAGERPAHRFPLGRVDTALAEPCAGLAVRFGGIGARLTELREGLDAVTAGTRVWPNAEQAEDWLGVVGQLEERCAAHTALFADYASAGGEGAALAARWISPINPAVGDDLELVSARLDAGEILHDALWTKCHAAICTSATLRALGTFSRFLERTGLPADTSQAFIPSPFDFPRLASLHIPTMRADPSRPSAHTEEIAALLPELLAQERSALVLFASWRQLHGVRDGLPEVLLTRCQIQGSRSPQALLAAHRAAIDAAEPSYLLGLASFAEGIDLPSDYCRHVVIAKLPFAVPDDPVEQATAEWVRGQGRDPFFELSVPDAATRLVQACGRLIRYEEDHGRITVLDRRIVTKGYGRALLDSLPPYRLDVAMAGR